MQLDLSIALFTVLSDFSVYSLHENSTIPTQNIERIILLIIRNGETISPSSSGKKIPDAVNTKNAWSVGAISETTPIHNFGRLLFFPN